MRASGLSQAKVVHRPRLLSDNGSSYISADLAKWLDGQNMKHVRGAPYHPMTQGKIERWHQTLKNRILLQNYYLPGDLEANIEAFVADYNDRRYHESIGNLTPADIYFGRGQTILIERERIKRQTIANRRLMKRTITCRKAGVASRFCIAISSIHSFADRQLPSATLGTSRDTAPKLRMAREADSPSRRYLQRSALGRQ